MLKDFLYKHFLLQQYILCASILLTDYFYTLCLSFLPVPSNRTIREKALFLGLYHINEHMGELIKSEQCGTEIKIWSCKNIFQFQAYTFSESKGADYLIWMKLKFPSPLWWRSVILITWQTIYKKCHTHHATVFL